MKQNVARLFFVMLFAGALTGCAGSFEEARVARPTGAPGPAGLKVTLLGAGVDRGECIALDGTHRAWGGVAKGAGVVAAGLGALEVPDMGKNARIGFGAGALAMGGVAAASVFISEDAATSWARDCR
jgi:hypothetical protein